MKMTNLFSSIRMLRDHRFILICCLIGLFSIQTAYSTHIVGGSIRYNCLGDNMYEVILSIKRDCNLGAADAPFDDPASVGIFDVNGQLLTNLGEGGQLFLNFEGDKNLQNEIQQVCFSSSNEICVHSTEYRAIVMLPADAEGYTLSYQRCCRNSSLINVVEPLQTGMTLKIELTKKALEVCNSSPAFRVSPDIFICAGDILEFDGSATDSDGDNLVYSLCTPLAGATEDDPRPQPPADPPYVQIDWATGYAATNPLGPTEAQFNAETGMFTVMPESIGQFLVGMCVEEYRDGELLSILTREFQYNVVECSNDFASDFSVQQNGCSLDNVRFTSNTPNATEYIWFFNYPNTDAAFMSTDPNPVFSYPQAGTYTIRLLTTSNGSNCESILDKNVTITDGQSAEIQTSVLFCDGDRYTFRVADPIVDRAQRQWLVHINGVQQTETSQFFDFEANRDDLIEVELTTTSATGCIETQSLDFNANLIDYTTDLITCSSDDPNQLRVRLTPVVPSSLFNNPIVSYVWSGTNGETVLQESTASQLEIDADFSEPLWVSLIVEFENGCTAEIERSIRPVGLIYDSGAIELENGSSTVTFFNNEDVLTNLFDNPNSEILNERIVRKDWIILSPSQGELRGEGPSIDYTATTNETIEVIYIYTTESGCVFEIKRSYTFTLSDLCLALTPEDDICQILSADPNHGLADLDCDKDGIDNTIECNAGTNPSDPSDACQAIANADLDICALLAADPNSPIAALDCDGDGFSNADECSRGSDPSDGCSIPAGESIDICAILAADPTSPLGAFDCDNGGVDNLTECQNGGNPNDASDDCQVILNSGINICELLSQNPNSPLAALDCDGDGFSNQDECSRGSDPSDGCSIPEGESIDICAILAADPNSPLGMFDCDGGGIDNATECQNGGNPNDPNDECLSAYDDSIDICAILAADPDSPLGALDCDGDGFTNLDECNRGSDPADGCDVPEGETIDICAILEADPNSPLGMFDCDDGGVDNKTECENGGDPNDPTDECTAAINGSVDICALLAENPNSALANLDCDGDGFTNLEECNAGSDPTDGCDIPEGEMIDICAILEADPDSPLGMFDCDGGGVDNATECENGGDPNDPSDECDSIMDGSFDICAFLAENPDSPLGLLDCDGDGVDNKTECDNGTDPLDPEDNCPTDIDIVFGADGGIPEVICAGVDTPISITVNSADTLFFEWAPSECIVSGGMTAMPIVNAASDKELILRVMNDRLQCDNEYMIPLNISDPAVTITLNPEEPINRGDNVELTAETNAENPEFEWSNGETSETFDVNLDESTDYMVTVTDQYGCMTTESITATVNPALCNSDGIFLPNSFSPNGDNINDVLFVRSNAIQDLEFSIFDRWGREVFKSNSIDVGWNGRWQNTGDELPSDAYAYWIKATCFSGEEFGQQGNVSIIR